MKCLLICSIVIILSVAYGGFFDELVSDVKSAGETLGSGAASAYNWTTNEAVPGVGRAVVGAGEAVGEGAVKAYNWTTEVSFKERTDRTKNRLRKRTFSYRNHFCSKNQFFGTFSRFSIRKIEFLGSSTKSRRNRQRSLQRG